MTHPSDENLMWEYQQGNLDAFRTLYQRYEKKVMGYLVLKVRDKTLAEEIFQSVFLKLHHSRHSYDPKFPFAPWLFTICRSKVIDAWRSGKATATTVMMDEALLEVAVEAASADMVSTSTLSPSDREALEMRYQQDLSFEEMAIRLRVSSASARQRVSRAVRRLRKALGKRETG